MKRKTEPRQTGPLSMDKTEFQETEMRHDLTHQSLEIHPGQDTDTEWVIPRPHLQVKPNTRQLATFQGKGSKEQHVQHKP